MAVITKGGIKIRITWGECVLGGVRSVVSQRS